MEAGELTNRMFSEYKTMTDLCIAAFGKSRLVDELGWASPASTWRAAGSTSRPEDGDCPALPPVAGDGGGDPGRDRGGVRPKPAELSDCGRVFLTYRGTAWVRQGKESRSDYVSQNFNKLLKKLGLVKPGCGFYARRHVFRTVADGARDNPAVRLIMGHDDASIDAAYRERIEDERLRAVANHVRRWLWVDRD